MAKEVKLTAKELQEKLTYKRTDASKVTSAAEQKKADKFCEEYKGFLNAGKTERECTIIAEKQAIAAGFVPFDKYAEYKTGDKVYYNNRGKSIILAVFGKKSVADGVSIMAAHIDSPRLDLKQVPLYEEAEMAYFDTHYYGGIKKYQWTAMPLALHGVVALKNGENVTVKIGEDDADPVFVITDLLPHLADDQYKREAKDLIKGEELNVLIGSRPFCTDEGSELVKLNILNILFEKYGMTEEDFLSAELELVPAYKAKDVGFDRSMIGSYGQDDRVCAFPALSALIKMESVPEYTAVTILTDKEEIGSEGSTGLKSCYLKYFISDLAQQIGLKGRDVLSKSKCLSADVNSCYDPNFPDVFERKNVGYLNKGVVVTKFLGSRGKGGTNDASAEYLAQIRNILDAKKVVWQTAELGRVDAGGAGTVAMYIANLNVDTVDLGVPVLSMHAPFEVTSKYDVYMTYKAFEAFALRTDKA